MDAYVLELRRRRWWLVAIATALVVSGSRAVAETHARARGASADRVRGRALGMARLLESVEVHVGVWPLLRLEVYSISTSVMKCDCTQT